MRARGWVGQFLKLSAIFLPQPRGNISCQCAEKKLNMEFSQQGKKNCIVDRELLFL